MTIASEPHIPQSPGKDADTSTRRQVEVLSGFGLKDAGIAHITSMDVEVLRRLYADELAGGALKANAKVAENLYRKATGEGREAVTAAIFWLKTRAGWKESVTHELTGSEDSPIVVEERSPRELAKAILFTLAQGAADEEHARQILNAEVQR